MTKVNKCISVAVGMDASLWHEKFAAALDAKIVQGYPVQYKIVNLDRHDWLQTLAPYDVVIWKPAVLTPEATSHFKEKIRFLESHLRKLTVPNFNTIWHYDSKIAQSFLFQCFQIPIPKTMASFDYADALDQLSQAEMPLVFKKSWGASSSNVRLVRTRRKAEHKLAAIFFQQVWERAKQESPHLVTRILKSMFAPWFWRKVMQKVKGIESMSERFGAVYWQEFIPGNLADLRITAIGGLYAYGFWRNNRPDDFRASGSGRIDYQSAIPEAPLRYCLDLNRRLSFDSMAYDILFTQDRFVITEMSYAYLDSALYRANGHYELDEAKELTFREGHVWPEALWIEWALIRVQRELGR